ncbi:MAG: hypothetical protein Q8L13_11845 [Bradyrhizobium sp.]|uniref:hypothetical protein n=1 Tax=Bradyrhizobium sp. TaxID=376 RepID=UPI00272EE950|nr:hypothetical protein [Bradyrhizobium sp.]MDP1867018.1 hypothetical protein [Bradyrhizobium sp.]
MKAFYPYFPVTSVETIIATWLIVIAILFVLWGAAALTERGPELLRRMLLPIAMVLILAALTVTVLAHDRQRPDLKPWFEDLRSGAACCDG